MARHTRGELRAGDRRFAIVAGQFNESLVAGLVDGAVECLLRHGADDEAIDVFHVPGAYEVPQLAARLVDEGYAAIVALGVLIRGETAHFELVARSVTDELLRLAIEHGVPVTHGIVAADTVQQAEARTGGKGPGRGWDAAVAAIAMADLSAQVGSHR